jgi:hypothetical protein
MEIDTAKRRSGRAGRVARISPLTVGIHVTVVEPGSFRTNFLSPDSVRRAAQSIPPVPGSGSVV